MNNAAAVADRVFFNEHEDRDFHIRIPCPGEFETEFRSLGQHEKSRRRVIVKRVERRKAKMFGVKFMPVPMLAFTDETIEDRDDVLRPVFDEIMRAAALDHGMPV